MCGIVGVVAKRPIAHLLINGLKRLEYRGYDSAGMAILQDGKLKRLRVQGKVRQLEQALAEDSLKGHVGIAHTRWATHGAPSEQNAHPFLSGDLFALVHNGIIENHASLRKKLEKEGYLFSSETDTETAVHLIHYYYQQHHDLLAAVRAAVNDLEGAYALAIIETDDPDRMIGVRKGAPLVTAIGHDEYYLASDPLALLKETQEFIYLEEGDIADISLQGIKIYDQYAREVKREIQTLAMNDDAVDRGIYRHFMKKEIMEQSTSLLACLEGRIHQNHILPQLFGPQAAQLFSQVEHIQLVACGTSYHAAMVARYWIESLVKIPCNVEIASEFRYRTLAPLKNSLFITLSQSGETADSLAALRLANNSSFLGSLVICNVPGSTMTREANMTFLTRAGTEIGVASTKAFITQLTSLLMLAISLRQHKQGNDELSMELIAQINDLPQLVNEVLAQDDHLAIWAASFTDKQHALFVGRGLLYPIALEGALKMKEISYIHAEGYPAGELKHGPLALVDKHMPVIATLPFDPLIEKTLSNLQEISARGGQLFILSDQTQLQQQTAFNKAHFMYIPTVHALLSPILYTIPLQLLSYHVAVFKGTDVDQPRNLAKSVTVE